VFAVPSRTSSDLSSDLDTLRAEGAQIVVAVPRAAEPCWTVDLTRSTVLVLGSEAHGVSPALMRAADVQTTIPMAAGVESLNAAAAAAVLLYEATRQRTGAS
jgi:TrmH family RNA methyltransferase